MLLILTLSLILATASNAYTSENSGKPGVKEAFEALAAAEKAYKIRIYGTEKNKEIYSRWSHPAHAELLRCEIEKLQEFAQKTKKA
jgi:hypothetical protein